MKNIVMNFEDKMKFYKVKFKSIVAETEKAICLSQWQGGDNVWLPKKICKQTDYYNDKSVVFFVPEFIFIEKKLEGKLYEPYHKPEKIKPIYNQEAIDELRI